MRPVDNPVYFLGIVLTELLYGRLYGGKVEGLERIPLEGRCIVACNHISAWDPLFVAWAISHRRIPFFPGKEEVFRNPVLGWLLRKCHSFPIDRKRGDVAAMKWALDVLATERCLAIYPEGTRSKTGALGKGKPGVGFLAAESGAPVIPARVRGIVRMPVRGELSLRFGAPLRFGEGPGEAGGKDGWRAFAERVMGSIAEL